MAAIRMYGVCENAAVKTFGLVCIRYCLKRPTVFVAVLMKQKGMDIILERSREFKLQSLDLGDLVLDP